MIIKWVKREQCNREIASNITGDMLAHESEHWILVVLLNAEKDLLGGLLLGLLQGVGRGGARQHPRPPVHRRV